MSSSRQELFLPISKVLILIPRWDKNGFTTYVETKTTSSVKIFWTELLKTLQRMNCTGAVVQETTLTSFAYSLANQKNWIFLVGQILPTALQTRRLGTRLSKHVNWSLYVMPTGHAKAQKITLPTFFSGLWFLCLQTNTLHSFKNIQYTLRKIQGGPKLQEPMEYRVPSI